jgi:vitamin B12 transporter
LLLVSIHSYGQDDFIYLKQVNITAIRSKFSSGLRDVKIDSIEMKRLSDKSLDQLLKDNSAISLKEYGPGLLSTVSLRGGSSYHTTVLWNGFQLNSPLHGNADLTLMDNLFFDNATILYGGASTLWGSGAVSGSIYLDNAPVFNNGLSVNAGISYGSYSNFSQLLSLSYGNAKYSASFKVVNNNNENNFEYYDENKNVKNQTNSTLQHLSFFTEHYLRAGHFSTLNIKAWLSDFDRQIPAALQQIDSYANQVDNNLRISAEWKYVREEYQLSVRSAYFSEKQTYDDLYISPSHNDCRSVITEAIFEKVFLKNHVLQLGTNLTKFLVDSSANLPDINLNRIAFFLLYRYQPSKRLELSFSSRKEISDQEDSPFLFSAGGHYKIAGSIKIRSSLSRVFRYPTINDLYWQPGGNKNLKPENGYTTEAGISFEPHQGRYRFRKDQSISFAVDVTCYSRRMNEWIIWYPSASYIWRPQNLQEVYSRGMETGLKFSYEKASYKVLTSFNYNYTLSTNEKSLQSNDQSFQKQLIYVPLHSANFNITFIHKNFTLTATGIYTGYRYITSDNSEFLPDYFTLSAEASQKFLLRKVELKIFVRSANVTNTDYQSISNRPMPLRTFTTGIYLTYRKPNKTQ